MAQDYRETGAAMKYVHYRNQGKTSYGILEGENIREIAGGLPFTRVQGQADSLCMGETGCSVNLGKVELLWPCEPSKILAVGLNYRSHLEAQNRIAPKNPEIFYMPVSALLKPGGEIKIPQGAHNVHYEGELVVVIGTTASRVSAAEAAFYIFGFTCGNDISERDWQKNDLQWWRAKGCDTFAPLGPVIVSADEFDWRQGRIETRVNGSVVQSGHFGELLFDPNVIVSYVSHYVTLNPGDVIYTGTPGHTDAIRPGDVTEVDIPGIGILRNRVAE
jgi:2-keto-4-pentenoate hydratase/2-oxohepta-3-ene-1,7-dioic acid hydratase in catechol pathway